MQRQPRTFPTFQIQVFCLHCQAVTVSGSGVLRRVAPSAFQSHLPEGPHRPARPHRHRRQVQGKDRHAGCWAGFDWDVVQWFAHHLEPVSFIVWDNLSSLNTALRCLQETEIVATDESGSDSDGGSSSSSFSSLSELPSQPAQDEVDRSSSLMGSGLDPSTVYHPPKSLQVMLRCTDRLSVSP